MARLQLGHHAAHVLHARGTQLGLDRLDRGSGRRFVHLRRQECLDHRDFGGFGVGQLLAAALHEHLDRFAALLDHLLQHFHHQRIVILGRFAGARFDVAVLDRGLHEAQRRGARFVAALHRGDERGLDVVTNH